ncbi:hypothetical protein D3C72_1787310 [compost metagenome]
MLRLRFIASTFCASMGMPSFWLLTSSGTVYLTSWPQRRRGWPVLPMSTDGPAMALPSLLIQFRPPGVMPPGLAKVELVNDAISSAADTSLRISMSRDQVNSTRGSFSVWSRRSS